MPLQREGVVLWSRAGRDVMLHMLEGRSLQRRDVGAVRTWAGAGPGGGGAARFCDSLWTVTEGRRRREGAPIRAHR
jgi:hypothetical protein